MIFEKMLAKGAVTLLFAQLRGKCTTIQIENIKMENLKKANNNRYHNLTNVQFKMGE